MTKSNKLVLGVGNFSKKILQLNEGAFPGWDFAVIDLWSNVQNIEVPGEECLIEDITIRSTYDLSFFLEKPKLEIRFSEEKYHSSYTQQVLRWTDEFRHAINNERAKTFDQINEQLQHYSQIIILMDAANEIAFEWLPNILSTLNKMQAKVLSLYPAPFEGKIKTDYASLISEKLIDAGVDHYTFFHQDMMKEHSDKTGKEYFLIRDQIFSEALKSLLSGEEIVQGNGKCSRI